MKKILIIEDDRSWSMLFKRMFSEDKTIELVFCEKVIAPDDPDFQELVAQSDNFAAIVWDGEIYIDGPKSVWTCHGFIQAFAQVFKGPMIANSRADNATQMLMDAGCTHANARKDPEALAELIRELTK